MSTKSSISDNIRSLLEKDGASIELKSSTPIKSEGSITAAELVAAFATTIPRTETVEIILDTESATVNAAVFEDLAQNQANLVIGKALKNGAILLSSEGRHALLAIQEGTHRIKPMDGDAVHDQTSSAEDGRQLKSAEHLYDEVDGHDVGVVGKEEYQHPIVVRGSSTVPPRSKLAPWRSIMVPTI